MNSIATQQIEALLYTGIPTTIMRPPVEKQRVDMKEFQNVASWLGLLLGVLTVAADIGGHVLPLRDPHMTTNSFTTFAVMWSVAITLINFSVFSLVRQMISMVNLSAEIMEAFESRALLWSIVGVTGSYTIFDFFFLPVPKALFSAGIMVVTIVVYSSILNYLQMWSRRRKVSEAVDPSLEQHNGASGEARLMIV